MKPPLFFYVFMIVLCLINCCAKETVNERLLFAQATAHYQQSNFQQALDIYESLEHKTNTVLYNMGLCHYYLGHHVSAIAYLRGAQKSGGYTMYRQTQPLINQIIDHVNGSIPSWHYATLSQLFLAFPLSLIQFLTIFIWFILFGLLYRTHTSWQRRCFLSGLIVIISLVSLFAYHCHTSDHWAMVTEPTTVHTGPHDNYQTIAQYTPYLTINIKQSIDGWYKVQSNDILGWIPQKYVVLIP